MLKKQPQQYSSVSEYLNRGRKIPPSTTPAIITTQKPKNPGCIQSPLDQHLADSSSCSNFTVATGLNAESTSDASNSTSTDEGVQPSQTGSDESAGQSQPAKKKGLKDAQMKSNLSIFGKSRQSPPSPSAKRLDPLNPLNPPIPPISVRTPSWKSPSRTVQSPLRACLQCPTASRASS